jgi:hypothetical protein
MEDVLDIYKRTYDPKRPQICMDEMPKQLLSEKYEPFPGKPRQLEKQDHEYERHGNANIFMLFEPWLASVLLRPIHIAARSTPLLTLLLA